MAAVLANSVAAEALTSVLIAINRRYKVAGRGHPHHGLADAQGKRDRPMAAKSISLSALTGFPLVTPGDDLAALVATALCQNDIAPIDDDILVVAQKVVSKAEGRLVV